VKKSLRLTRLAALVVLLVGFGNGGGLAQIVSQGGKSRIVDSNPGCLAAARTILGPAAVVLRCGELNAAKDLEVVAVLRRKIASPPNYCEPLSRFVVLRYEKTGWKTILDGAKEIKNPEGYVGLDYIDDSPEYMGIASKRRNPDPTEDPVSRSA
jgi:hypothetical protein